MKRARKSGFSLKKEKNEEIIQTSEDREEKFREKRRILLEKSKKAKKRKKYVAIFSVSLVVIIVASLIVLGIGGLFDNPMVIEEIEPVDEVSGKVNVLILGVDKEGLRTDTIIVASYDANDGIVNMLSIPSSAIGIPLNSITTASNKAAILFIVFISLSSVISG